MDMNAVILVSTLSPLAAAILGATVGGLVTLRVHKRNIEQRENQAFREAVLRLQTALVEAAPDPVVRIRVDGADAVEFGAAGRAVQMGSYAAMTALPKAAPKELREHLNWVAETGERISSRRSIGPHVRRAFFSSVSAALTGVEHDAITSRLANARSYVEQMDD